MSCAVDEFAVAITVLSVIGIADELNERISQEDRNLLFSWFASVWTSEDDNRLNEEMIKVLENKLKELKGI